MNESISMTSGQLLEFYERSDFFRILECVNTVDVRFYSNGAEVSRALEVGEGYAETFSDSFDKLTIYSSTNQTIQFVSRFGNVVNYDKSPVGTVSGSVSIDAPAQANLKLVTVEAISAAALASLESIGQGAFTQAAATVTNASAQLLAANAARHYLLIQNNDVSGIVYVNVAGAAAAVSGGIKIEAGGSLELSSYVPSGAIYAIGNIASNANVTVVEG